MARVVHQNWFRLHNRILSDDPVRKVFGTPLGAVRLTSLLATASLVQILKHAQLAEISPAYVAYLDRFFG